MVKPHTIITECVGSSYLLSRNIADAPPLILSKGLGIEMNNDFTLASRPDSYLEIKNVISGDDTLRLGQSTAIEIINSNKFHSLKGSFLYSSESPIEVSLISDNSNFSINAQGTWLSERTITGFKMIPLEGKLIIGASSFTPGEMIIISSESTDISSSMEIDLALLLRTSRLINSFPIPLGRSNQLLSAAQVQALRMKKKYDAFIGGVTDAHKLRVWSVNGNEKLK